MELSCAKVSARNAESVRKRLFDLGILAKGYKIIRDADGFIYFPLTGEAKLPKALGVSIAKKEFEPHSTQATGSVKDALAARHALSDSDVAKVIRSYDCVGDIAIAEIPDELVPKQEVIAQAIMAQNGHIKVVARKDSPMLGEFRVRKITVIAGEKRTTTTYRESGCSFAFDVAKVYFSVRLSHERLRIASLVKPREKILALFAGVGPFAIVIAKRKPKTEVVGIELNPDAVRSFEKNILLNKTPNVKAILGDVKKVVPQKYRGWADRIMMPLPHSAGDFLDAALIGANPEGCTIHFYGFVETKAKGETEFHKDIYAPLVKLVKEKARNAGMSCRITGKRVVRPFAAYVVQVVIDFKVRKA
ncbi:MAG: class I SAM-dependent methyltransferase family protein [Candidatus Micrarchaeia archaeon]|jgi:tRNA (guanine37-N1)-methyltransferase